MQSFDQLPVRFQETGNTDVVYMQLDLASLQSVHSFSQTFLKTESRLDLLINNAGRFSNTLLLTSQSRVEETLWGFSFTLPFILDL